MKKIFTTTIVLALMQIAKAQTDPVKIDSLDEVVVTATKFPKKLSETGKVLTVITQQQLQQNSSHSLGEILNRQPGILIAGSTTNSGTNQSVFLRGATAGNTLILIDGVPVYDASGISTEFDLNYININQVERVEILKGAQSTLYGSDAVAGVINIIMKKAINKPVNTFAEASAGTYGTINTAAGINGTLDKFQYNVGGSYLHTKGLSSAYDSTSKANFDKDGFTQYAFNASAGYKISSQFSLRAFTQFNEYKAALDASAYRDDKNYNLKDKNAIAGVSAIYTSNKNYVGFNYQYNVVNRSFVDDSTDVTDYSVYQKGIYKGYTHFAELYDKISLSTHTELLFGADFRRNSTKQSYEYLSSFGNFPSLPLNADTVHTNQTSLYASFFIKNITGFNAEIGGRVNNHSLYGWNETYSINPSFIINTNWKLFATVASAYHVPSLYQLYSEYGNKDLKPEQTRSYEAGLQFSSPKIKVRTVVFKRNIKDVISFYTDPVTYIGYYINANKQKDNGFETEVNFYPVKALSVSANYAYADGKIVAALTGKDTSFFNLYRRPRNVFNFNIAGQIKQFTISSNLHATSYFYEAVYASVPHKFNGYYTLDIYAAYKLQKNLTLFADARNITDQKYFELPGYNSKRFNIMAGIRANF